MMPVDREWASRLRVYSVGSSRGPARRAELAQHQLHAERGVRAGALPAHDRRDGRRRGFPLERIIFEFSESEQVTDTGFLRFIVEHYETRGLRTAIDDFGAGYSGLMRNSRHRDHRNRGIVIAETAAS
jgi:hypothetical protein